MTTIALILVSFIFGTLFQEKNVDESQTNELKNNIAKNNEQ